MRTTLYVVGAIAEFLGIVLVASPDLVPGAVRAVHWIRRRWRPIENRLRRSLRLEPRSVVYDDHPVGTVELTGRVSAIKSTSAATLEDKVEFLLARDQDAQRDVNELAARVAGAENDTSRRLATLGDNLKGHVAGELAAAQEDYRTARLIGAIALVLGLGLTTTANFIRH